MHIRPAAGREREVSAVKSLEKQVLPSSEYYNFSPSALARKHLLHAVCVGDFCYAAGYELQRDSFDSYLMEVILEGQVQIETEGELLTARAGQVALVDCNKPHRYASRTGWHALWVHFDGPAALGYFQLITRENGRVFATHRQQEIHAAIGGVYEMFHRRMPLSETQMALYLTQALTAMADPARPADANDRARLMDKAVACINQRIGAEPSVAELARMTGLSEYHFIRVFREIMGATPRQYIIANRMNHAKDLLKTTGLPVGEIGSMVGYASESMFTAAFRRTQGMAPSKYRSGQAT